MNQLAIVMMMILNGHQDVSKKPVVEKPVEKIVEVPVVAKPQITDDEVAKIVASAVKAANDAAPKKQEVPWDSIIEFLKWAVTAFLSAFGGKVWALNAMRKDRGPSRTEVATANAAAAVTAATNPIAPVIPAVAPIATLATTVNDSNTDVKLMLKEMADKIEKLGAPK